MSEVVLVDPEAAGLPAMLAALIEAAVADPARAALLDRTRGRVTIVVPDAEVTVGLHFADGICRVVSGALDRSDVVLTLDSATLLDLPSVPLLAGLPSVLHPRGRAFARAVLRRRVVIRGVRHVGLVTALNRLLTVA